MRIGIDAGGTFTDFIVYGDDGRLETFKIRSNPSHPAQVILEGLRRVGARAGWEVVHGSTVATNALLERKGARTALVTTAGFEDVIQIGRQNRAQLYVLNPAPKRPLIPRANSFGLNERIFFDGSVEKRPSMAEMRRLKALLRRGRFESVAICFLHAYQNAENEKAAVSALRGDYYLCSSHEVCAEFREYERTSTTLLNAYVGPLISRYLAELERGTRASIVIMQSNGGLITASEARQHAVRTLLSGPAGGAIGAVEVARQSGFKNVLAFDMGGTSTDVSLAEGAARLTMEASIDGFPVRVPMLDIHTVGAGGGSIARVDEGGLLRVGPESAGADPGPACYGTGTHPTVTDAHVVLGRISAHQFLGGAMEIDAKRAEAAIGTIAKALGVPIPEAAQGILRVANANMERAVRVVSVERGYDPRGFALLAFGGCGGLHGCEIADGLGMRTVLVPEHAGVLSALGMLVADRVRDYSAGVLGQSDLEQAYRKLERTARKDMPRARLMRTMDVRYAGQSYELTVSDANAFHAAHQKIYGYADMARAIEVVAVRVRAVEAVPKLKIQGKRASRSTEPETRRVRVGRGWAQVPAYSREQIGGREKKGPLLVLDYGATTFVPAGWTVSRDRAGSLIISK